MRISIVDSRESVRLDLELRIGNFPFQSVIPEIVIFRRFTGKCSRCVIISGIGHGIFCIVQRDGILVDQSVDFSSNGMFRAVIGEIRILCPAQGNILRRNSKRTILELNVIIRIVQTGRCNGVIAGFAELLVSIGECSLTGKRIFPNQPGNFHAVICRCIAVGDCVILCRNGSCCLFNFPFQSVIPEIVIFRQFTGK